MNKKRKPSSDQYHIVAIIATVVLHALLAVLAMLVVLDEPLKDLSNAPIALDFESPYEQLPKLPQAERLSSTRKSSTRDSKTSAPAYPATVIRILKNEIELADAVVLDSSQTEFQRKITTKLFDEMSQEEAFDKLMDLMQEYPEYKETILRKMVAGKDIQFIPDLAVSTGLKRLIKQMRFKTKYEYEAGRQQFLYGPYGDPVLGPRGYQQTGVQVNFIELLGWFRGLIKGK